MYARVEIKCEETLAFYEGFVKDVQGDMALVAYEGGWQRDAWLNISSLRPALAPYHPASFLPSPGDVVEVRAKSAEHEPYSWWRGSVKAVRTAPMPALVEAAPTPPAGTWLAEISYAGWENEFTETLEKDMLRPFNTQPCFAPGPATGLEKHTLPVAAHLAHALSKDVLQPIHHNAGTLALHVEPAGTIPNLPPGQAQQHPPPQPTTQPVIQVIGSKASCQRAVILLAQQLQQLNEQMQQQQQQQQQHQQQHYHSNERMSYGQYGSYGQQDRYDQHSSLAQHHKPHHGVGYEHGGGGYGQQSHLLSQHHHPYSYPPSHGFNPSSSSLAPYSSLSSVPATPPLSLEFHCPPHLMGMVIGKRHKNLYIAENLAGVHKVHVDTENGSIVVIARTAEAAAAARSLLELTEQTLNIPSVIVGRVVGKNFSTIKEIEQHSGVLRIKVGDDRDHDMEVLQHMALHGIPGLNNVDEHGNPLPNPAASAALAAAAAEKEKESHKRSAFDRPYQFGRDHRGRGGRGHWEHGRSRWGGHDSEQPEEFDIVALEDDSTVEISIIGSPATVSEAELLLRTHIGLITQIYKLSYDEAMLERQVHALTLVVPGKHAGGVGGSYGHGHADKRRGGAAGKDEKLPAWMQDVGQGKEEKLSATATNPAASSRLRKADPSMDIHAARLQGDSGASSSANGGNRKSSDAHAGSNGAPAAPSVPSYKSAAVAGVANEASAAQQAAMLTVAASAASAPAAASAADASADSDSESDAAGGSARASAGGSNAPRKRGGRKEKMKRERREQRDGGAPAQPQKQQSQQQQVQKQQSQQQQQQQQGQERGRQQQRGRGNRGGGGAKKDSGAAAAPSSSSAAASASTAPVSVPSSAPPAAGGQ